LTLPSLPRWLEPRLASLPSHYSLVKVRGRLLPGGGETKTDTSVGRKHTITTACNCGVSLCLPPPLVQFLVMRSAATALPILYITLYSFPARTQEAICRFSGRIPPAIISGSDAPTGVRPSQWKAGQPRRLRSLIMPQKAPV